jgi:FkbM family methyltransferase
VVPPVDTSARPAPAAGTTLERLRSFRKELASASSHPGNAGHHIKAFGRVTSFHINARVLKKRTCVPIGDHSKMWADRRFPSTGQLILGNPPDWKPMQAWKLFLRPGTLFVDIGANAGIYSLWAADLGSTVISVEPHPEARRALAENAALNGYEFEIVPAALSREAGVMRFTDRLGPKSHLKPLDFPRGVEVSVRTLDDVLGERTATGVKVDVEGAERLVLEGARVAIAERRLPLIQLEWNNLSEKFFGESRDCVAELLTAAGYQFFRPDDLGRLQPTDVGRAGGWEDVFAVLAPERGSSPG